MTELCLLKKESYIYLSSPKTDYFGRNASRGDGYVKQEGFQSTKNDTSIENRQDIDIYSQKKNFMYYSSNVFITLKMYSADYKTYNISLSKVSK